MAAIASIVGPDLITITDIAASAATSTPKRVAKAPYSVTIPGDHEHVSLITPGCRVVVYVGDVYEEPLDDGLALCDALRLKGTKLIILQDSPEGVDPYQFRSLARRTGGAVLPFAADSLDHLRDLLQAIAVLAVGGVRLLEAKRKALPGAQLLLEHLGEEGADGAE